jgi:hypothetical protein
VKGGRFKGVMVIERIGIGKGLAKRDVSGTSSERSIYGRTLKAPWIFIREM